MNSPTLFEEKNHNYIGYTNQRDVNVQNISEMNDTGLQDGVDIAVTLLASTLHQYTYL